MSHPMHITKLKHEQGLIGGFFLLIAVIFFIVVAFLYVNSLNTTVINKFESRRWDIPATVYSRPLSLYIGKSLTPSDLQTWLKLLHYTPNTQSQGGYTIDGDTFTIHTRGFRYGDGDTETPQIIRITIQDDYIAKLQSSKSHADGIIRLEPIKIDKIYPQNNEDRKLLTVKTTPQALVDALIATEDRNFYQHYGVSMRGTARALITNAKGEALQGGSTITQQLVKNFYLSQERTLKRKINEAVMALLLDYHYSKNDILLAYLNEINLGQNGNQSINGFGAAAEFYYNKPLSELRLDQYALLVGIARGPSYYNPKKNPERAKSRRNTVLHNMLITGKISQQVYENAINQPLDVIAKSSSKNSFADFMDAIKRELRSYYREEDLQNAGLSIISTLDPLAQMAADKAMTDELVKLKRQGGNKSKLQGAIISAETTTGQIVAIVGSGGEFTGFNRAIDAKRQVGSLLKPVIYLSALQSGAYNLASGVSDDSVTYRIGDASWTPKNYDGTSHGTVPLITALSKSYNQAAVNVGMQFGMDTFRRQMAQLGINQDQVSAYPSALLGAVDLSPYQMLGVYQVFSTGGKFAPLHTIISVTDEQGRVLQRHDTRNQTRLSPEAAYLTNHAMQSVITSGTAKAANFNPSLHLAGKTGTTNDNKDAWFAGYSGNYVSVVWVGRDDNKPIGLTGGTGALPIWIAYMRKLNLTPVELPKPNDITWAWLELGTGRLSSEGCPNAAYLPINAQFSPDEVDECTAYRQYEEAQAEFYDDQYNSYQDGFYQDGIDVWQDGDINRLPSDNLNDRQTDYTNW
ncbi:penicillin-binding protein 1B [Moraxella nasovis]|uniref:penicillin-binding protein 1B n=1 Tax=Moraxella nasovis TaxID=2904121 RepID=UPI001F609FC3|nr:penicillin-binding protein 1B [Moraxella nasovis]UNU72937.1 penicillin-binding protein 1B [Moraxella nasovis]